MPHRRKTKARKGGAARRGRPTFENAANETKISAAIRKRSPKISEAIRKRAPKISAAIRQRGAALNSSGRLSLGGRTLRAPGEVPKSGPSGLRVGSAQQKQKFGPKAVARRRKKFGHKRGK